MCWSGQEQYFDIRIMFARYVDQTITWISLPVLSVPRKSTSFLQYRSCRIEIILLYPISRSINGIDVTHFYSAKRIYSQWDEEKSKVAYKDTSNNLTRYFLDQKYFILAECQVSLHLLVFLFVYQFNFRIGVLVDSSFANDQFRRFSTTFQHNFKICLLWFLHKKNVAFTHISFAVLK